MNKTGFIIYHDTDTDNCNKLIAALGTNDTIVVNDKNSNTFPCVTRTYRGGKKYFAACVNDGLREMSKRGYEHIFIIRDTTFVPDNNFIDGYIKCFNHTGNHILFNFHKPKYEFDYKDTVLCVNDRLFKHFFYVNINCIKQVGYLDEKYEDTFEVLDYYYRLYNKGLTGPIGYFAAPNTQFFDTMATGDFGDEDMLLRGLKLFRVKYGYTPVELPLLSMNEASQTFQKLYTRFVNKT